MERYDDIVVGAGAGGLTASVLLGMAGHRVLLLDKGPCIGGSLARFTLEGIPFDVGFHFTGGLCNGGVLDDILKVLEIREYVTPIYLSIDHPNRFVFEEDGSSFDVPAGVDRLSRRFKEYFPSEKEAIDQYFALSRRVCQSTTSMNLRSMGTMREGLDEDYVSLQDVLDRLTSNRRLKALLSGFCMCYGVKPTEVSFANHARICLNIYESVARVHKGGDAFLEGFKERLKGLPVTIRCGTTIARCEDVRDRVVHRFVLTSGEEVAADRCVMTLYPQDVLNLLPREYLSPAFIQRASSFEPSNGFFTLYGEIEASEPFDPTIISLLPSEDVCAMLDPSLGETSALVLLRSLEEIDGQNRQALVVLEPAFWSDFESWQDSFTRKRPANYLAYKQRRTERVLERISRILPSYSKALRVVDCSTPLTFRDYLFSPHGCAFGVQQKMGQLNLFGKLPLRNILSAGQSGILPGVVGTMMASFLVVRMILGNDVLDAFIHRRVSE